MDTYIIRISPMKADQLLDTLKTGLIELERQTNNQLTIDKPGFKQYLEDSKAIVADVEKQLREHP